MDITVISEALWRVYPAAALALCGLALLARGLWFGFTGSRGLLRERDALGWMRGFRLAVVGICLVGNGVGGYRAHAPFPLPSPRTRRDTRSSTALTSFGSSSS